MKNLTAVIRTIQLTEKATRLKEKHNQYLFEVDRAANKLEVKKAVERLFRVQVTNVNIMNYRGKRKRERSANYGMRSAWKRAVVTLKTGDAIELT
ncbi:MAG: 50S ribosomal protein L23 [Kiritimatiellae bacterium]|nr:50S ribosomal protein L23 [Kiritimatiellia bacterium]